MRVELGHSKEMFNGEWRKIKLALDETDLKRLLVEGGVDPETQLSTVQAFQLLETEAQRLILVELVSRYPMMFATDENAAALQGFTQQLTDKLERLKPPVAAGV